MVMSIEYNIEMYYPLNSNINYFDIVPHCELYFHNRFKNLQLKSYYLDNQLIKEPLNLLVIYSHRIKSEQELDDLSIENWHGLNYGLNIFHKLDIIEKNKSKIDEVCKYLNNNHKDKICDLPFSGLYKYID